MLQVFNLVEDDSVPLSPTLMPLPLAPQFSCEECGLVGSNAKFLTVRYCEGGRPREVIPRNAPSEGEQICLLTLVSTELETENAMQVAFKLLSNDKIDYKYSKNNA